MDERERQRQATRIEGLLQEVAAFPDPQVRAKTEELLGELLELYGTGLARIVELISQDANSDQTLLETFAQDELVGSLLLLHGLHPIALETRLLQAIENVQASVQKRGGSVALERLEDGVAYVRLTGGGSGCASTALTQLIEEAVYSAAPDLAELRIQEAAAPKPVKFTPRRRKEDTSEQVQPASDTTDTGGNAASVAKVR